MVKPNTAAVIQMLQDAEPVPTVRRFEGDPQPGHPRNDVMAGQWEPDALGLPPGCPVVPLGVDGSLNWFLDPIGQLHAYTKPYGQADTLELFRGRHLYLYWAWPKWSKKKDDFECDAWRNEKAREALIAAATAKGPWNAVERVRGRGAWRGPGGGLIMHCGHEIVLGKSPKPQPPGELDGFVYPARPRIARPAPAPAEGSESPLKLLKPLLESWAWSRPRIDPHLLLGWIGAAFLSGALDQRPIVYITGDKGTGKSTLQHIIKGLFGEWLIQAVDTSAAGIYQHVGQDSLPIAVDEFEGKADTRKAKAVLELARQAYSGGLMLRGGDRHQGVEFRARSAFLFSSINTPPLEPQDLSRLALLRLNRLPPGPEPDIPGEPALAMMGRMILRRLLDQWDRFAYTLKQFRDELRRGGMDARGCDTFGTLLACADLIEHDGPCDERLGLVTDSGTVEPWADVLAISKMIEFEDAAENWRVCLDHMLSVPVEAWRNGTKKTVGQVLEAVYRKDDGYTDIVLARTELAAAGLTILREEKSKGGDWLAVPNQDPSLRKLFENTKFAGDTGASVWGGALRQSPRGDVHDVGSARINGRKARVTLIKLSALYGPGGLMVDD